MQTVRKEGKIIRTADIVGSFFVLYFLHMILTLLILALPIACISWTVTHEEIFREPREWFIKKSKSAKTILGRKLFYPFTCEYCFSHYVTVLVLIATKFYLFIPDWRGYVLAGFALVWIANMYMTIYYWLRMSAKLEEVERKEIEEN